MIDVLIIGAGPAGSTAALALLAEAPALHVRVLEQARFPRDKPCAGALGGRADAALGALGVRVEVPSVVVRALSAEGLPGRTEAREAAPLGRVVRRLEFDAALADAARARGAELEEGTRLSGLELRADRVTARVESEGRSTALDARLVIGADGVGSVVRRALGLPRGPLLAQAVEVDTELVPGERDDELHFDLRDRSFAGYAWDFPTPLGGRTRASRGVYALGAVGARVDVGALLEARLAALGASPLGAPRRYAERGFVPGLPLSAPRVLLVGEAGGIDPALGEGIAQAIQLGALAGAFAARALRAEGRALELSGWAREVARSRVGLDLHVRSRAARWMYGPERARFEAGLFAAPALARAGAAYFAGWRVPRRDLARAAFELATSSRWPPWSSREGSSP